MRACVCLDSSIFNFMPRGQGHCFEHLCGVNSRRNVICTVWPAKYRASMYTAKVPRIKGLAPDLLLNPVWKIILEKLRRVAPATIEKWFLLKLVVMEMLHRRHSFGPSRFGMIWISYLLSNCWMVNSFLGNVCFVATKALWVFTQLTWWSSPVF